jgi:hypothetical protein
MWWDNPIVRAARGRVKRKKLGHISQCETKTSFWNRISATFLACFCFSFANFPFPFFPPMNIKTILLGCWMALMVGLLALSQQLPAPWQSYCWGAAALGGAIGTAFIFLGRR